MAELPLVAAAPAIPPASPLAARLHGLTPMSSDELELELLQMLQESLQREEMEAWGQRCAQAGQSLLKSLRVEIKGFW